MRIREALLSDHSAISELAGSLDQRGRTAHPTVADLPKTPARTEEWLATQLRGTHVKVLVAENDRGDVTGFVRAHIGPTPQSLVMRQMSIGWLHEVVVAPNADEAETARALLEHIKIWLISQNVRQIRATIWDFDRTMIPIFESLGYAAINRTFLWDEPISAE